MRRWRKPSPTVLTNRQAREWGKREWKMRDGTLIQWSAMEVSHIRNCAAMLRRNGSKAESDAWGFAACVQGDMASYYADQEAERASQYHDACRYLAEDFERYADWRERPGYV